MHEKSGRLFIVVYSAMVTLFAAWAIWYVDDVLDSVEQLREKNRQLVESIQPSGGAEASVQEPAPQVLGQYILPIHRDDYLMYTSPFGYRISPIFGVAMNHLGIDIAATWRAQVVPIADGKIIEHWPPPGTPHPNGGFYQGHPTKGGYIVIRHADGVETDYSHLSATYIREGQTVKAGQVIGRVGDTGLATGPHLHFGMKRGGKYVNPLLYLPEVAR